ncbi:DUF4157 domain-containing protein [Paenibacillus agaridevorans]|uniref:eCIS core domain-containing protein n=1 Tax=Paenibacillus agaridevorans TaxID=171404 RepID=UPI001BE49324|nr:DUF4157 domain-containing protein [Paenibacillus agaridevorans]
MKESAERRRRALTRHEPKLSSRQPRSSQPDSAAIQRRKDGSPTGQLARLQASAGNQAVLQRLKDESKELHAASPSSSSPSGGGKGMPEDLQAKMEQSFGADFSNVRIHVGSQASQVGALAYTQGSDIHFAPGQYKPDSRDGQQLLGHELSHVIQQREGRVAPTAQLSTGHALNDSPALEQEADRMGAKAANAPEPEHQKQAESESEEFQDVVQRQTADTGGRSSSSYADSPIQRMPRPSEAKKQLGEPKERATNQPDKKFGMGETLSKNNTHYRALLQKLELFDRYVDQEVVGNTPEEIDDQLSVIMSLYNEVENVSDACISHNKNDDKDSRADYIRRLKKALPLEKRAVRSSAAEYKLDPAKDRPLWALLTSKGLPGLAEDLNGVTGTGGSNTIALFEIGPDKKGMFKETKLALRSYEEMSEMASENKKDSADDENGNATMDSRIDRAGARLAAMSRLDKLLNAGVIAGAEMALYNSGISGSGGRYKSLKPLNDDIEASRKESFNVDDPVFQRAISRLQLIDTLAMQADLQGGNFMIERDDDGNVLGVKGLGNDMAIGAQTDLDSNHQEYPGISKFVDRELAKRILALKPDDLRTLMEDLLAPAEINALVDRLVKLQNHLRKEASRLLAREEWSTVNERLSQGDTGYGSDSDIPASHSRSKTAQQDPLSEDE